MKKLLFSLTFMIFAVAYLTGCKQDPSSSLFAPMKTSAKPPPPSAHPEIALAGTATISKNITVQSVAVMDSDGTNLTNVFNCSTVSQTIHRPTWSGDGTSIAFIEWDPASTAAKYTLKKFTVTVTGGVATGGATTTLVTNSSTQDELWASEWSPSTTNSLIAYTTQKIGGVHGGTLYTVPSTGGATTTVTSSTDCNFIGITWNPDASKIAVVCQYFKSGTPDSVDYDCIKIFNTSGTLLDSIGIAPYKGIIANNIEWSRAGLDKLAYTTAIIAADRAEFVAGTDSVLTQDANSTATTTFVVANQHPTWSPTNWKFAYGGPGISTVITATKATSSLTTTGNLPNWKK